MRRGVGLVIPTGSPSAFVTWPDTILVTTLADQLEDSIPIRLRVYSSAPDVTTGRARTSFLTCSHAYLLTCSDLIFRFSTAGAVSALFLTHEYGLVTCMQYGVVASDTGMRDD
jgi:hypothetical protein